MEGGLFREKLMAQQALNKKPKEESRCVLEAVRDMNLENTGFSKKQNLVAKLGVKVHPSEDVAIFCRSY